MMRAPPSMAALAAARASPECVPGTPVARCPSAAPPVPMPVPAPVTVPVTALSTVPVAVLVPEASGDGGA